MGQAAASKVDQHDDIDPHANAGGLVSTLTPAAAVEPRAAPPSAFACGLVPENPTPITLEDMDQGGVGFSKAEATLTHLARTDAVRRLIRR